MSASDSSAIKTSQSSDEATSLTTNGRSSSAFSPAARNHTYPLLTHAPLRHALATTCLLRTLINGAFPLCTHLFIALYGPSKATAKPTIIYHTSDRFLNIARRENVCIKIRRLLDRHGLGDVGVVVALTGTDGEVEEDGEGDHAPRIMAPPDLCGYDPHSDIPSSWPLSPAKIGANISAGPTDAYGTLGGYISLTGKWKGRYALTAWHVCFDEFSECWEEGGGGPERMERMRGEGTDLREFWRRAEKSLEIDEEKRMEGGRDAREGTDLEPFWRLVDEGVVEERECRVEKIRQQRVEQKEALPDLKKRRSESAYDNLLWKNPLRDMYNLEEGEVTYPSPVAANLLSLPHMPGTFGRVVTGNGTQYVQDYQMDWALLKLDEKRMGSDERATHNIRPRMELSDNQVEVFDEGLPREMWVENTMPLDPESGCPVISGFRSLEEVRDAINKGDETRLRILRCGATSGRTVGRINSFPSAASARGRDAPYLSYNKTLSAISFAEGEDFCVPGDSGSLCFDRYGQAVGVFCWYSQSKSTMFAILMPFAVMVDNMWHIAGGKDGDEVEVDLNYIKASGGNAASEERHKDVWALEGRW